jgi:hypothetical protein
MSLLWWLGSTSLPELKGAELGPKLELLLQEHIPATVKFPLPPHELPGAGESPI